ncbi:heterokaryon incompatibility protein-domain-containing protein [Xylariales sp. PMI_506]|nr:heterokaryon incompatibility protein-domain-containing protein [Xylariales sp. PMI_506]
MRQVYRPLTKSNQIRLLALAKGDFEDPIHGMFAYASLGGDVHFKALSYTWTDTSGDNSRREHLFLGPHWDIFMVTANCLGALRRLRRRDEEVLVWVDAICIDQGNHSERNQQVGMIRQIYAAATEVAVYLGEGYQGSKDALDSLRWAQQHSSLDRKGCDDLLGLFKMPYFYRVWVVQEIANAKSATMILGQQSIGWSILDEQRLQKLGVYDMVPKWMGQVYGRDFTVEDLPHLLEFTNASKASDQRDKIFAIFGLLKDAVEHDLVPDYRLSVEEVYIGITAFLLANQGNCKVLEHCVGAAKAPGSFGLIVPSWVTYWERDTRTSTETTIPHTTIRAPNVISPESRHPIIGSEGLPRVNYLNGSLSVQGTILAHSKALTRILDAGVGIFSSSGYTNRVKGNSPCALAIFQGCDAVFILTEEDTHDCYQIEGIFHIEIYQLKSDTKRNISGLDPVSHAIYDNLFISRGEIQNMVQIEWALRLLGQWDGDIFPRDGNILCETTISDDSITQAFDAYVRSNLDDPSPHHLPLGSPQRSMTDEGLERPLDWNHSTSIDVQWLESFLHMSESRLWQCLRDIGPFLTTFHSWELRLKSVETILFYSSIGWYTLTDCNNKSAEVEELENDTISLISTIHEMQNGNADTAFHFRFGKKLITIRDSAELSSTLDAGSLVAEAVWEMVSESVYSSVHSRLGDNARREYRADWDWGELQQLRDVFNNVQMENFKKRSELRTFLRTLQPQQRQWEWLTIV